MSEWRQQYSTLVFGKNISILDIILMEEKDTFFVGTSMATPRSMEFLRNLKEMDALSQTDNYCIVRTPNQWGGDRRSV